jgi:uncharacterized protein YprB with RNaseH-like and TPR domain
VSQSVSDRLRAAFGTSLQRTSTPPAAPQGEPASSLAGAPFPDGERPANDRSSLNGVEALPGRLEETDEGLCWLVESRYPLEHRHGEHQLGAWLNLPSLGLGCLVKDAGLPPVDPRQVVFLDTETTGLAGGTGTVAFLIGLAYLEPVVPGGWAASRDVGPGRAQASSVAAAGADPANEVGNPPAPPALVVRQLFMRDFGEERAVLAALARLLEPFRYVVTFNGKSFDLPLIETRYVLARLPWGWRPAQHFDLLHPSRRLWRQRLASCSLLALEQALLGHWRQADVPSWAIPSLYAAYLRYGQAEPLRRVFEHNRQDLLSLATLLSLLGRRLADPLRAGLEVDELLAVARLYDELGLRREACACFEAAAGRAVGPERQRVVWRLALAARRAGRYERARALWQELAVGPTAPLALIELAKHHEHRRGDIPLALALVEEALSLLDLREARDGLHPWRRERLDLERRLARLLRKRGAGLRPGPAPGRP